MTLHLEYSSVPSPPTHTCPRPQLRTFGRNSTDTHATSNNVILLRILPPPLPYALDRARYTAGTPYTYPHQQSRRFAETLDAVTTKHSGAAAAAAAVMADAGAAAAAPILPEDSSSEGSRGGDAAASRTLTVNIKTLNGPDFELSMGRDEPVSEMKTKVRAQTNVDEVGGCWVTPYLYQLEGGRGAG